MAQPLFGTYCNTLRFPSYTPIPPKFPISSYCRLRIVCCAAQTQPGAPPTSIFGTNGNDEASLASRIWVNYQPTVWKDDFIDSLVAPYEVSSPENKRIQTLIKEIKTMFNSMGDGETVDTEWVARVRAVDTVERLGIDRHFKKEIKKSLDCIYRHWDERGSNGWARVNPVPDLSNTAIALRLLRLYGYNVSSDVLRNFQSEEGVFCCFAGVADMLNLYRCSQVAFPGEKIMEDAETFAANVLENAVIEKKHEAVEEEYPPAEEVEYALRYPWHRSMPRLEARNYIEQLGSKDVRPGKTLYKSNDKYLELAKLDFNMVQSLHQREIQHLFRWWRDSGFDHLTFTRQRLAEMYFAVAANVFEPEYEAFRIAYAKTACIAVILDDLYEIHGSLDDVKMFSEAVKRWDLSLLPCFPDHQFEICFLGLYNTVNELGKDAFKAQGRDVLGYLRKIWEDLLESYIKEAEWTESKHVPPSEEYIENGKVSVSLGTVILNSIFFMGELLPDHILQQVDFRSKFLHLVCFTGRLMNDTKTFQVERERGEVASSITCYMRENPKCREEEALNHIYGTVQHALRELNWELANPSSNVPLCIRKMIFNTARAMQLFYVHADGFTISRNKTKDHVSKILFQPLA